MPAQTHSPLRLNVKGIDFPGLSLWIETAVNAEPGTDSRHTYIITDDTDSLKSDITNLLKARFEGRVVPMVIEHPKQTLTSAYRGIKVALASFFNTLYASGKPDDRVEFSKRLRQTLGDGFPLFASFVPESTGESTTSYETAVKNLLYIESELFPVLNSFFTFLTENSTSRVFFFVNEFHNVDGPSLNLFAYLHRELPPDCGIWIAAGNDSYTGIENLNLLADGTAEPIFVGRMYSSLDRTRIEQTLLKNFGQAPPEWIEFCVAKGISNEHAIRNIALTLSDGEAIHDFALAGNVKALRNNQWSKLSDQCRQLMSVITCFGGFDFELCAECFQGDRKLVEVLLNEACEHGFIRRNNDSVEVVDSVALQDILSFIPAHERERSHYTIAHALYRQLNDATLGRSEELIVGHFNEALYQVQNNNEQELCAELNLKVGLACQREGNSRRARELFTIAADLLKECPWHKVDNILFQVLFALSRLEYKLGEYDPAEHHVDYLLERVKDVEKRASLFELKVVINNRLGRYRKAVLSLKEGLMELGLDMPWQESEVARQVEALTRQLPGYEDPESIVSHEEIPHKPAILKLLFVGGMSLHHTSDGLMTWGALQIIQQAGRAVGSGEKAIGYVVFGRVQIMRNEIERGYNFGKKALHINRSLNDLTLRCRVYGIFAFFIKPWKRPFDESFQLLAEAGEAGEKSGDLIGAYVVKTHRLNLLLLSGKPLESILDIRVDETNPSSELTYYITHYQKNLVRFLRNESNVFSIPHLEPSWLAASNTIQEEKFYRNFVWSRYYFLFGYFELAVDAAFEANENRKLQEGAPLIPANYLIWSLSISQNWQNIPEASHGEKLSFLKAVLEKFSRWAEHSPANFRACYLLLRAELCRIEGDHDSAIPMYALASEENSGNLWYKAIAFELAAKFHLSTGRIEEGVKALIDSIDWYTRWGAPAKVSQIQQQFNAYLAPHPDANGITIEAIQHELSGYLQVRLVIKKLLALCLRISGSSYAVLASREGNSEAEVLDRCALFMEDVASGKANFAAQKIHEALRHQDIVVGGGDEATASITVGEKPAENRSFLVVPVFLRDHLSFVLYLESDFTPYEYSRETIRWIRIALNQGAISIENARIHELSLKLNEEIRQKMEEKERLMTELKAQRDLHLKAVERTQNEDRKRIASHLHDSVGSMLSSIKMRLNGFQNEFQTLVPEKAEKFSATIALIDETVQELRRIVYDMMPVSLHRFGLQPTLYSFVDQINESQNVQIELQVLGLEERLNEELEIAVYRICQELLQNVLKHAAATAVRIQIIRHVDRINVIVEDNGVGMSRESLITGIGFDTITTKVNLYRGTFEIESSPGKGTMILIDIPVTDVHA